jgi:Fur family ferric uptake transcriptional regulator
VEATHAHAQLHANAADAAEAAVRMLRDRGERVTSPRRAVIEALAATSRHLTADEIVHAVGVADAHRATVYRTVEMLERSGVLSVWREVGGPTRFHLLSSGDSAEHVHARCRSCGAVEGFASSLFAAVTDAVDDEWGFSLDLPASVFSGLCRDCRARSDQTAVK